MASFNLGAFENDPKVAELPEEKANDLSPWQWLDLLTEQKVPVETAIAEYGLKSLSPYMVTQVIGMDPLLAPIADELAMCRGIHSDSKKHAYYVLLGDLLPARKFYIKWLEKKASKDDKGDRIKRILKIHYEFNDRDLEFALRILPKEKVDEIMAKYPKEDWP